MGNIDDSLSFTSDGMGVWLQSDSGFFQLYDLQSSELLRDFSFLLTETRRGHFYNFAVSPDGTRILGNEFFANVKLVDTFSGEVLRDNKGANGTVLFTALIENDMGVLTVDGNYAIVWDAATATELRRYMVKTEESALSGVHSGAISPDATKFVTGSPNGDVNRWSVATGELLQYFWGPLVGHVEYVESIQFSSNGARLVTGSEDDTVKIWDVAPGELLNTFRVLSRDVVFVSSNSDGSRVFAGTQKESVIWDAETAEVLLTLEPPEEYPSRYYSGTFSPDGSKILLARGGFAELRESDTGTLLRKFPLDPLSFDGNLHDVAFSPDGTLVVTSAILGPVSGLLGIWDEATGILLRSFPEGSIVNSFYISTDNGTLLSANRKTAGSVVELWDVGPLEFPVDGEGEGDTEGEGEGEGEGAEGEDVDGSEGEVEGGENVDETEGEGEDQSGGTFSCIVANDDSAGNRVPLGDILLIALVLQILRVVDGREVCNRRITPFSLSAKPAILKRDHHAKLQ